MINVLRQLLFLEIVSVMKIQNKLFSFYIYEYKVVVGVELINELFKSGGGGRDVFHSVQLVWKLIANSNCHQLNKYVGKM